VVRGLTKDSVDERTHTPLLDDADVAEVFGGRVKDWVLALVEEWAEIGRFPFEEPGRSF
jgi:hypothetical protein